MALLSRSAALALLDTVLDRLPVGAHGDVRLEDALFTTMRFANSRIHQPHGERSTGLSVRVERDKRLATATTTDVTPTGIRSVVDAALELARVAPVEERFPGFPGPEGPIRPVPWSTATARMGPEDVARIAQAALDAADSEVPSARISGAANVGSEGIAIGNSSGLRVHGTRTMCQMSVLVERLAGDPPTSGWAEEAHWDAGRLGGARLGREAAGRVARTAPTAVKPGAYRVVLAGPAMAELVGFLSYLGFGGHAEEEGWSCLRTVRGKRRFPTFFEAVDDGRSPRSLPYAFDYEGVEKRRTPLIDRGRVGLAATDLVTGGRLGRPSSGHAFPPEAPWGEGGPYPSNVLVTPGDRSIEELVHDAKDGVLVTRFHYVRVVHPGRGTLTGMTRDGTYRIRHGELESPAQNLRFTESTVEALRHLSALGRDVRRYSDDRGSATVTTPAGLVDRFRFTSATLF